MAFEPDITILQVIQAVQSHFIEDEEASVVYEMMLAGMLDLTESEYGFIAEVLYNPEGAPYLRTLSTTNIAWDDETRAFYEKNAVRGLEFHNLNTLFGAVLTSGETVIANDAPNDARRGGLPPGHPEMNSFLGMPLYARGKLAGMAGVANRIGGYEGDLVKDLEPFLTTCASIIKAYAQLRRSGEAEQALLESEGRYRRLVEDQPDLICRFTPEGNLTFVNRAYASFHGKELSECVGTNLFESVPEPDRAGLRTHFATLRPTKPFGGIEHRVLSRGGEVRWVYWTNRAFFDSEGRTTELQSIGSDVTDRKRAEEDRRMLEEQVRQAQKLDSLGVLAGGIAHDFNNLLTGIMGNASLALMGLPSDSGPRGNIEQVLTSSRRAADLCRQMLAYSGRGSFFTSLHDVSGLVEDTAELLRVSIPRNAEVELRLHKELPRIVADDTQVRQVVMNLVTNAAEALPERGGRIEISSGTRECDRAYLNETILGEECSEGRFVYVEVADTGSGIGRGRDLDGARAVNRARTAEEFARGISLLDLGCASWVFADVHGHIGYRSPCLVPVREHWRGTFPVPGWLSRYRWQGFIAKDELPASDDPERGWLATANNQIVPSSRFPTSYNNDASSPNRFLRIARRIQDGIRNGGLTAETSAAIQMDIRYEHWATLRRELEADFCAHREPSDPDALEEARRRLCAWDGSMDADPGAATGARTTIAGRNVALTDSDGWERALTIEGWEPSLFVATSDDDINETQPTLKTLVFGDEGRVVVRIARDLFQTETRQRGGTRWP